jgi:hypothetical protein
MKLLSVEFIKIDEGVNETELPISKGTRVLYNGSYYEAVKQDTGRQGWEWRLLRGRNTRSGDLFFFQYDHPIYQMRRDNSHAVNSPTQPSNKNKEREVQLPAGVDTPQDAFFYAMNAGHRIPDLEYLIAKDPEGAARYAVRYQFDFVLAEPNIEAHPYAAMLYANGFKHKRYNKQIEDLIKTDPRAWNKYASTFKISY